MSTISLKISRPPLGNDKTHLKGTRAPSDEVHELTERFDRNRESYLSGQYNETQLRREFLDPLFIALGWDVNNKQGYAEAYKGCQITWWD
jgi:hypothetical protein